MEERIHIDPFITKQTGDSLEATEWNELTSDINTIADAINEIPVEGTVEDGISISSEKGISVESTENTSIQIGGNLNVSSDGDVVVDSSKVDVNAEDEVTIDSTENITINTEKGVYITGGQELNLTSDGSASISAENPISIESSDNVLIKSSNSGNIRISPKGFHGNYEPVVVYTPISNSGVYDHMEAGTWYDMIFYSAPSLDSTKTYKLYFSDLTGSTGNGANLTCYDEDGSIIYREDKISIMGAEGFYTFSSSEIESLNGVVRKITIEKNTVDGTGSFPDGITCYFAQVNTIPANMNKINLVHGGGSGLEFGTFNTDKSSLFTSEYRFNKHGVIKLADRFTEANSHADPDDPTTANSYKINNETNNQEISGQTGKTYVAADNFYDFIDTTDPTCTWEDVVEIISDLKEMKANHQGPWA